ncbi:ribonuclease E inhibitor RraB [Streptomyces sp. NPDC051994]|uniref:ribonuclease E inhibitor RraB n=1 Tax=Streptomyces sp. NPDC051994 TaxID=3155287 RepID=UPI00343BD0D2
MTVIPYTHWAYFPDEASARNCAKDLADYVTRIEQVEDPSQAVASWLLLAGRDVEINRLVERHDEVEEIVIHHGGEYDGGEATYNSAGEPVVDPVLLRRDEPS